MASPNAFKPSALSHAPAHGSARDEFLPRRPKGMRAGALMALGAHGLLVLGLATGLRWRASEPDVLSAELWAATPQQAAPAPVVAPPPPPPPPSPKVDPRPEPKPEPTATPKVPSDADIALEKKRQAERDAKLKADKERKEKLAEEKRERDLEEKQRKEAERKAKDDEAKLAKQRDDQLKRMQALAGATGAANATGQDQRDAAPSAEYGGRVKARIKPNIVFTSEAVGNPVAEVEVRVAATGRITGQRLVKSSGNKAWDEAVIRAVVRTEVLPRDVDGRVPPIIVIEFRPNE